MYYTMSISTLSKITHLKSQIKKFSGADIDLTSETIIEDILMAVALLKDGKLYDVCSDLLDDLVEQNPTRKHKKAVDGFRDYLFTQASAAA